MKNTKLGFTLIELAATIGIMAVLAAVAFPFISEYTGWAKQRSEIRTLNLINDAVNRYRATEHNDFVLVGANYPTPNGIEQNEAVLTALSNGSVNTYVPGDKFLRLSGTPAQMASRVYSEGSGTGFQFYDYSQDGPVLGIYVVTP